jgi:hypothetical protein
MSKSNVKNNSNGNSKNFLISKNKTSRFSAARRPCPSRTLYVSLDNADKVIEGGPSFACSCEGWVPQTSATGATPPSQFRESEAFGFGLESSSARENGMAWYWPDLDSPQSAKTAVVNAVGVSAFFAVYPFLFALQALNLPRRSGRLWVSLAVAILFAMIGWGIRRMSRTAAIVGVLLWLVWIGFHIPSLISGLSPGGDRFATIWVALDLLFLLFYVIAVRATFAYHGHLRARSTVAAQQVS